MNNQKQKSSLVKEFISLKKEQAKLKKKERMKTQTIREYAESINSHVATFRVFLIKHQIIVPEINGLQMITDRERKLIQAKMQELGKKTLGWDNYNTKLLIKQYA